MSEKKTCVEKIYSGTWSRAFHFCGKRCVEGSDRCKIHAKPNESDHFPVYRVSDYNLQIVEETMAGETDKFWIETNGSRTAKFGQLSHPWKRTRAEAIKEALFRAQGEARKLQHAYAQAVERVEKLQQMSDSEEGGGK